MKLKVSYGGLPSVDGVRVVRTPDDCETMVRELLDSDVVGVDTETTSLDLSTFHPIGKVRALTAQFANHEHAWFVPLYGPYAKNWGPLKKFVESEKRNKTLHNAKFDAHVFANHGLTMNGLLGDTMVMDFLFDSSAMSHALKECMRRYFGMEGEAIDYKDTFAVPVMKKNGEPTKSSTRLPSLEEVIQTDDGLRRLIDYSVKDPIFTVKLYDYLKAKLEKIPWRKGESYLKFYEEFDLPYTGVLYRMERRGCLLDTNHLRTIESSLGRDIESIRGKFIRASVAAGVPQDFIAGFNMGSPKQVAKLIEKYLGVRILERTEKGAPSTDDASLNKLKARGPAKEIVGHLLEMRRATKFLGTYVEPLLMYASEYNGKVHTGFRQTGTHTSRLSSSTPNL